MNGRRSVKIPPLRFCGIIDSPSARRWKTYEWRWRHCRRSALKIDANQEIVAEEEPFPYDPDDHDDYGGGMEPMDWYYEWEKSNPVPLNLTASPRLTLLKLAA